MRSSSRRRAIYVLSIVFAVAPFAFAMIRVLQTRSDLRLVWMAIASLLGTFGVMAITKARARKPSVLFAATFVTATLCAGATAFALGATAAPGAWAVAVVFGACWAAYSALHAVFVGGRSESMAGGVPPIDPPKRMVAATELALIFPASLFLAAVVARRLEPLAHPAQQVVTWYSDRFWTLWVLLIALPLAALLAGCVTLLPNWNAGSGWRTSAKQFGLAIHAQAPTQIIAATTLGAGLILTVVVLHMLAN